MTYSQAFSTWTFFRAIALKLRNPPLQPSRHHVPKRASLKLSDSYLENAFQRRSSRVEIKCDCPGTFLGSHSHKVTFADLREVRVYRIRLTIVMYH